MNGHQRVFADAYAMAREPLTIVDLSALSMAGAYVENDRLGVVTGSCPDRLFFLFLGDLRRRP